MPVMVYQQDGVIRKSCHDVEILENLTCGLGAMLNLTNEVQIAS
jgi:hypothetical protein